MTSPDRRPAVQPSAAQRLGWASVWRPLAFAVWSLSVAAWLTTGCGNPPAPEPAKPAASRPTSTPQTPSLAAAVSPQATGAMGTSPTTTAATATPTPDRSVLPADAPAGAQIVTDITPGVYGGKLVEPVGTEPETFNEVMVKSIGGQEIAGLQFGGLTGYDSYRQKDVPGLSDKWEYNEQTREWRFHIREGLRWSDGQPLTADDFLFYTEVIFNPTVPSDRKFWFQLGNEKDSPRYKFTAPDPHTLVVKIPGVDSFAFLNLGLLRALPRHVLEKPLKEGHFTETWGTNTPPADLVVSGPFKLKELRVGESAIFERNPYYASYDPKGQRLPFLDQIVMLVVEDAEAEETRFLAGDLDVKEGIQPSNLANFTDQAPQKGFTVYNLGPSLNVNHYWFNLNQGGTYLDEIGARKAWQPSARGETPPAGLKEFKPYVDPVKFAWFSNREFRIACSEATDRQSMIDTILFGEGAPLYGPESPSNKEWCNPDIPKFPYNLDSAKKRLEAIGMIDRNGDGIREDAQGNPIRFTLVTNRENNIREKVAQQLKADLKAVGFDVEVQVLQFNNLLDVITKNYSYDCCLLGLGTGIPPHPAMGGGVWQSSGDNHGWYPKQKFPATEWEAELDRMYAQLKQTFDREEQHRIFFKMQEIFCREQPVIDLFAATGYSAARNKLGNLKPTPLRNSVTHNVEEIYLKP